MKSVKTLFLLIALTITVLIFTTQAVLNFTNFRGEIQQEVQRKLTNQVQKDAQKLYADMSEAAKSCQLLACDLKVTPVQKSDIIFPIIKEYVLDNPMIYGSGFWLEPNVYADNTKYYGPYFYKDGDQAKLTWDYSNDQYNYFQYDWYKNGIQLDKGVAWTEPYVDSVSGVAMLTISSPIVVGDKKIGITTADISLKGLQNYVKNIKVGRQGYAFVVTSQGYYLADRKASNDLKRKITEASDASERETGKAILASAAAGTKAAVFRGEKAIISYAPIGDTGLKLVDVLPDSEAFARLGQMKRNTVINLTLSLILFGLLLYYVMQIRIVKPLQALMMAAGRVAGGDLTIDQTIQTLSKSQDETGRLAKSFGEMVEGMRHLVSQINGAVDAVTVSSQQVAASAGEFSKASEQVAATIADLAEGANKQAEAAQEGNHMVADMLAQLALVVENTQILKKLTGDVSEVMKEGSGKVEILKARMEESRSVSQKVGEAISSLSDKSKAIGDIVAVISEIAEQTNLLALNAAIEAARAGEQGRGFAVVAEEVRKLAEQSAGSSNEIRSLIDEIRQGINLAVGDMQKEVLVVVEQDQAVEETSRAFTKIKEVVESVNEKIDEASESAQQLKERAQSIGAKIEMIADVTQENASGTEEVAASSQEQVASIEEISAAAARLAELTEGLKENTKKFRLDDTGPVVKS